MSVRAAIPPATVADVLVASRRRCCFCYALVGDSAEKRGQIAHIDRDSSNSARDNLVYICLDHHDQYDSTTSQSKGLTPQELRQYIAQLARFIAESLPRTDLEIAQALLAVLDRPAFRTPFHIESSLPRFRDAIAEAISVLNTGRVVGGGKLPSKAAITDRGVRSALDGVVGALVRLRAAFDELVKKGEIRRCDCKDPDCSTHTLSDDACHEMDRLRLELLANARQIAPDLPGTFY